jgi:hypothetical protein
MASPWALERFGGLTGALSKRLPQALGSALERAFTRRNATDPATGDEPDRRHRALRHTVLFAGSSHQGGLLDSRWGEPGITDDAMSRR